jgi:ribonuclease P protein component
MGMVVPKYRNTGVARNRLKRRLREIGRRELLPRAAAAGQDVDFLVRARREAYQATFVELREELVKWMEEWCSGVR